MTCKTGASHDLQITFTQEFSPNCVVNERPIQMLWDTQIRFRLRGVHEGRHPHRFGNAIFKRTIALRRNVLANATPRALCELETLTRTLTFSVLRPTSVEKGTCTRVDAWHVYDLRLACADGALHCKSGFATTRSSLAQALQLL